MTITLKQDYSSVSKLELDLFQEITSWCPRKTSPYYFELLRDLSITLKNKDPSCYQIALELSDIQKCNQTNSIVGEKLEETIRLTNQRLQELPNDNIFPTKLTKIFEKAYNETSWKEQRRQQSKKDKLNNKYGQDNFRDKFKGFDKISERHN